MALNGIPTASQLPSRRITIAAAQLGPIHPSTSRSEVLTRMLSLLSEAHAQSAQLIVYPELASTTFFPRYTHLITSPAELESYFEHSPTGTDDGFTSFSPGMSPLFSRARELGIDVSIGFAECDATAAGYGTEDWERHSHWNSAIYWSAHQDRVIGKYRKVHLPGTKEPYANVTATNQLEKRYFAPGNLGFEAFRAPGLINDTIKQKDLSSDTTGRGDPIMGILICNDRRWSEAWRCYGLQGVEVVLCGFNTTAWAPEMIGTNAKIGSREKAKQEAVKHHFLTVRHGSYTNACWSVNVAKCGVEDPETKVPGQQGGFPLIGGTCIVDPDGDVVAEAHTEGDEVVVYDCDLGMCRRGKGKVFAFERHRRTEAYGRLVEQTGVVEPPLLD